ncbi:3-ketoacyl-CoA thiolase, peroxisomal [Leucoagaricus sp. SymC.cos]|nr:3-ketoacyl-CoA thiolase, peroxisomal [Leucoagaricus sp. SymC.cos]
MASEKLFKLKPSFTKNSSTHVGNASQVSDGAAAVLLARRSVAKKLDLPIVGKFVDSAVVGVPPRIMGVSTAFAIPNILGLTNDEVDFYEVNKASASPTPFSIHHLKIPFEKVNLNTIAIGLTGARQVATGLVIAKPTNQRTFVTFMCIGSGMGMAAVSVSEH